MTALSQGKYPGQSEPAARALVLPIISESAGCFWRSFSRGTMRKMKFVHKYHRALLSVAPSNCGRGTRLLFCGLGPFHRHARLENLVDARRLRRPRDLTVRFLGSDARSGADANWNEETWVRVGSAGLSAKTSLKASSSGVPAAFRRHASDASSSCSCGAERSRQTMRRLMRVA